MWKKKVSIENISRFEMNDQFMFTLDGDGLIQAIHLDDIGKVIWEEKCVGPYGEINAISNIVVHKTIAMEMDITSFVSSTGSKIIFPFENEIKNLVPIGELINDKLRSSFFYYQTKSNEDFFVRIEFNNDDEPGIIWKKNIGVHRFIHSTEKEIIVSINKGQNISKIDFETGNKIWDFSLLHYLPDVKEGDFIIDLYLINEKIIATTNEGAVFGLEKENGLLLWNLPKIPYPNEVQHPLYVGDLIPIEEEKLLIGFRSGAYWEIDIDFGEIVKINAMGNSFAKAGLGRTTASQFTFEKNGNLILFQENPNNLISFNRKTFEIDSLTPFEVKGKEFLGPWQGPFVNGDLCFLKDSLGTLHIFQKNK